jgi:L-arabinonolactonase
MSACAAPPLPLTARIEVDSRCTLGEGVLWDERTYTLLWTDIHASRLYGWRPHEARLQHWRLPDRLGSFALCQSGKWLLALAKGLYLAEPAVAGTGNTLALCFLAAVEPQRTQLRCNDGRVDRAGNFVFGTLNEDAARAPIGRFYQFSMKHGLRELNLGGVAVPNSLCFDIDGRGIYFCDTPQRRIMHGRYDAEAAHVDQVELFASVEPPGSPDGAAIDRHGRLWSAHWGAGGVVCYDRDGRIAQHIAVPTLDPSCVAFGGPALDTAFITTAREDMTSAQIDANPQAGGVFRVDFCTPVGMCESRFADS